MLPSTFIYRKRCLEKFTAIAARRARVANLWLAEQGLESF
jgi:hypothetical protein